MAIRRFPIGAEVIDGGTHFRVWAPRRKEVEVVIEQEGGEQTFRAVQLYAEADGYFSGAVSDIGDGDLYRFRLDGEEALYPDPASRFQPQGPHGPSRVVDPRLFNWSDSAWPGVALKGGIIYEMHIGTFTPEGTWAAATRELPEPADLGVTVLEIMPIADFPGRFGWGYDGVDLFAPTRLYGDPDDCRAFVDRAHSLGMGVILDVVYNHLGPDGNYLRQFSTDYFTDRYTCEWGEAVNFDGPGSDPVREFFTANAGYWIEEFHFDGLRLDATHAIFDASEKHILSEIARAVRRKAKGRSTIIVAEDEQQRVDKVLPLESGGFGLDGLWNDDFHHSALVALTGHNDAYYTDYLGTPQEFVSAVKWGYLFQGQYYKWQKKRRGTPTYGLDPSVFVVYLENHDQVANSGSGLRCHALTGPGNYRAMTALLLLAPHTPMLFQGQEFAASSPFLYFADHHPELAALVKKGRFAFLSQFMNLAGEDRQALLDSPGDPATFEKSKIDFAERMRHKPVYDMHRDLIRLRRTDPVFGAEQVKVDGAVLAQNAFVLRYFHEGRDRLLLINFGRDLRLDPAPEPLLAPPVRSSWRLLWSSEDPRYGGSGTAPPETEHGWRIPGQAAVVLFPQKTEHADE